MAIIDVLKYEGPNDELVWKWTPKQGNSKRENQLLPYFYFFGIGIFKLPWLVTNKISFSSSIFFRVLNLYTN